MPDAAARADLPSFAVIGVVVVGDWRTAGTLDELHEVAEPRDVLGVVGGGRSLGQRVQDEVGDRPGLVVTVTSPLANSVRLSNT